MISDNKGKYPHYTFVYPDPKLHTRLCRTLREADVPYDDQLQGVIIDSIVAVDHGASPGDDFKALLETVGEVASIHHHYAGDGQLDLIEGQHICRVHLQEATQH